MATFRIVEVIYEGMTQLDFTAPHTVFSRIPDTGTIVASVTGGAITSDGGLTFAGTVPMAEVAACDLLFFPGGFACTEVMNDAAFMREAKRLGAGARYLTSVCTGSLILAATGLIRGRRAACHWAWRDMLKLFDVVPDPSRVARDGDLITGGGVTAGMDFALTVAAELAGEAFAQGLQLGLEYSPAPPFRSGTPDEAPPEILAAVRAQMDAWLPERVAEMQKAAAALA
ncbi:MAG TPA: DJ-1/PfpI family protein [Caulobacteraceae bacterium]|jgi:putative intracellular protease/amidase